MESRDDVLLDDDVQILEDGAVEPRSLRRRSSSSVSEERLNLTNGSKRRRPNNFPADDEQPCNPGISTEPTGSSALSAAPAAEDDADDGCSICYEEYTSAGEHRLASVKCGHFFGYSCIARWIRSEGRNAVCPTCKSKATMKDVRKHYSAAVKVADTTEVEMLRNSNAALHIRISGLEVELARKDRELTELIKRLHDGKANRAVISVPLWSFKQEEDGCL